MDTEYLTKLQAFVKLIESQQTFQEAKWSFELGRKYDKVLCVDVVRYFVERSTGNIYGARSNTTPHLGWYMGNLDRCHLWDWAGWHGVPVNDPDIRPIKSYGPFIHYRLI